jgi:hypothetical protein
MVRDHIGDTLPSQARKGVRMLDSDGVRLAQVADLRGDATVDDNALLQMAGNGFAICAQTI